MANMMLLLLHLFICLFYLVDDVVSKVVDGAFIVKLAKPANIQSRDVDHHALFHKRAAGNSLNYTVRHDFKNHDIFFGLSVHLPEAQSIEEARAILGSIEGLTPFLLFARIDPLLLQAS